MVYGTQITIVFMGLLLTNIHITGGPHIVANWKITIPHLGNSSLHEPCSTSQTHRRAEGFTPATRDAIEVELGSLSSRVDPSKNMEGFPANHVWKTPKGTFNDIDHEKHGTLR